RVTWLVLPVGRLGTGRGAERPLPRHHAVRTPVVGRTRRAHRRAGRAVVVGLTAQAGRGVRLGRRGGRPHRLGTRPGNSGSIRAHRASVDGTPGPTTGRSGSGGLIAGEGDAQVPVRAAA